MNINALSDLIGTQWVYAENDCWAIVQKAAKRIFGVEINDIKIPEASDHKANSDLFEEHATHDEWVKVDNPLPGDVVLYRGRSGRAVHCGIMIEKNMILHCPGSPRRPESTRYEPLKITLIYYPECEFYRYAAHNSN